MDESYYMFLLKIRNSLLEDGKAVSILLFEFLLVYGLMSAAVVGLSVPGQESASAQCAGFNFSTFPVKTDLLWSLDMSPCSV